MREIAGERRRFGYRRIGLMLEREGIRMNHKKLRRLYTQERLQVKRRRGRKRARGTRAPMPLPSAPNARWSLDFVSDVFGAGRRFRILVVPDEDDEPWPEPMFLRQGVRAKGFVLLDRVSIGYFSLW